MQFFYKYMIFEIITTNGLCRVKYEYNSISHSTLKHVELNNIGHVWYKACRIFISQCLNKIFIQNSSILIHLCITKFLKIKENKISRDDILTKCLSNSQHWAWKCSNLKYFCGSWQFTEGRKGGEWPLMTELVLLNFLLVSWSIYWSRFSVGWSSRCKMLPPKSCES